MSRGLAKSLLLLTCALLLLGGTFGAGILYGKRAGRHAAYVQQFIDTSNSGRVPGEFEHQAALMLGCNELIDNDPRILIQIVSAVEKTTPVICLVANEQQRDRFITQLQENQIPTKSVHFFVWPVKSMWVQDYGPFFRVNGHAAVVAFTYDHPNRDLENLVPMAFASLFGMPIDHAELNIDGGNLLSTALACASRRRP